MIPTKNLEASGTLRLMNFTQSQACDLLCMDHGYHKAAAPNLGQRKFILVGTNHFTKWAEAKAHNL